MAYLTIGKNKIIGSSVSTDDNVVTVIDDTCTDEQVPSAKAVHTAIQNVSGGVPTNAYTKEEVDNLLDTKVNVDDLVESYSKDEMDTLLADKANVTDTYNKTEIDALLDGKANTDDVTTNGYTKEEVDNLLANKADSSSIVDAYTKEEVDNLLTGKADATALDNYVLSDELDNYALTSSVYNKTEVDDLLTGKVNTTSVVTTLNSNNVDEEIPSAKAVYDAIQNVSAGVPADVYSKTEIDNLLDTKADTDAIVDAYNKTEVDDLLVGKANATDIVDAYTKDEVNTLLDDKVNVDDLVDAYSKTEVDNLLANKADSDTIVDSYSKDEVDDLLADKADTSAIIDAYTKDETNDLLDAKVNVADLVDAYSKTEVDGLLTAKVDTSDVVTILSSSSTDEEIPSAKTVFDAIQSVSAGVPADVYSKTDVDNLLANKADTDDLVDAYSKTEVNDLLDNKANVADIIDAYTKEEVDNLLDSKVNTDDLVDSYSKDEVDNLLDSKADSTDIIDAYTKTEVDNLLNAKVDTDDLVDAYSKTEVDGLLANKADSSAIIDAYTKDEVNDLLDDKANADDIIDAYTKTEVDGLLTAKVDTTALDGKLDKTAIVTSLSSTSTDEQVPSALATKAYVDSKEVKISTEENNKIETKDDGIFVSKDYVEITQAEYDLLTEEEKEDIVFYITDASGNSELVTVIDNTCTDEQVPSAKAVHTAIQNLSGGVSTEQLEEAIEEAKTDLENEIANIPKVTKTSELNNDSGFITANDIPDVNLEPYALKTQIPTTLPASDVYDWAKEATKPTYTASEVGALASNGTAVNAQKVNGLTVLTAVPANAKFTDTNTWRGIQNNLTSTSTTDSLSAYQGKLLNDEITSLKTTSVNGKQTVADAINGKCGTSLTSATTYADMAYYINNISTGAISKNYKLATSGSISQKIKLAIIVFKGADESFTLEFASAMSGYIYYASNTGSTYDSRSSFSGTTTKLSNTVSNAMAIIVFDEPVAISSITCSSDCRGIFIY